MQFVCIGAQIWVYYSFEKLLSREHFNNFTNVKVKLRIAYALFMLLMVTRTIYFTEIRRETLANIVDDVVHFNEQIFIYISEIMFSLLILGFLFRQLRQHAHTNQQISYSPINRNMARPLI